MASAPSPQKERVYFYARRWGPTFNDPPHERRISVKHRVLGSHPWHMEPPTTLCGYDAHEDEIWRIIADKDAPTLAACARCEEVANPKVYWTHDGKGCAEGRHSDFQIRAMVDTRSEQHFLQVGVTCLACGTALRFVGIEVTAPEGAPTATADGTEARLWLTDPSRKSEPTSSESEDDNGRVLN